VAPVVDETDDGWHGTMAVNATGRRAALEHAPHRIRINAICPVTPLRRRAEPEEISSAVAFLASDEAIHITGAELAVDGGYLAR